jgi:hypothetical protein
MALLQSLAPDFSNFIRTRPFCRNGIARNISSAPENGANSGTAGNFLC